MAVLLSMVGCRRIEDKQPKTPGFEVARVGQSVLYSDALKGVVPEGVSSEDSLKLIESYVDSWARKEFKTQQAHRILANSSQEIDRLVEEYRNSLLIRKLDQYYVDGYVTDSLYGEADLLNYYETHKNEFKLSVDIVKGRIVAMPKNFPQKAKIKELIKGKNGEALNDLQAMCEKNKLTYVAFNEWTDYSTYLQALPTKRNQTYGHLLREGVVGDMIDNQTLYYFIITEFKTSGSVSPYERIKGMIRLAVEKQRREEIVRQCDDSLYRAAISDNNVVIKL
jgi:hypothetical protein